MSHAQIVIALACGIAATVLGFCATLFALTRDRRPQKTKGPESPPQSPSPSPDAAAARTLAGDVNRGITLGTANAQ